MLNCNIWHIQFQDPRTVSDIVVLKEVLIDWIHLSISDSTFSLYVLCQQYGEESSKTIMKCREPDYAGQYSPWSCETIGSYIGSKDAKPKDVMVPGTMEMMVSSVTLSATMPVFSH